MVESTQALFGVIAHLSLLLLVTGILFAPPVRKRLRVRTVAILILILGAAVALISGILIVR